MHNSHIKISKNDQKIEITFGDEEVANIFADINATFDIDLETKKIVGIEVINLLEQSSCKNFQLEEFQAEVDGYNLHVTYDEEYDALYLGLEEVSASGTRTIQGKCTVKSSSEGKIVFIMFEL